MNIPAQNYEIERIYQHIWQNNFHSIVFTSANAGEGVSTTTLALAQRLLLSGHRTLVVDLNLHRPSLSTMLVEDSPTKAKLGNNTEENTLLPSPSLVSYSDLNLPILGIPAPTHRNDILKLRQPGMLQNCIQRWRSDFDFILIDTPPVNHINSHNIPSTTISAAVDACYLVVKSGYTLQTMIVDAMRQLKSVEANVAGCILNDMQNPSLKSELLRECQRIKPLSKWLCRLFSRWINQSQYLSIAE